MEKQDIKYLRYADDWIILAKTKHKLRKAVKKCKQILAKLKIEEHPDKTDYRNFNNPEAKSFNFLGVEFNHNGAKDIKKETKDNFVMKISRLYEQILEIMRYRSNLSNESELGRNLIDYFKALELLMIERFIRSLAGTIKYFDRVSLHMHQINSNRLHQ